MASRMDGQQAQREARRLICARARSFQLASHFLPPHVRRDVEVVYAYYRTIDDLVDAPPAGATRAGIEGELAAWEAALRGRGSFPGSTGSALAQVIRRHGIPPAHLGMVLDGARFDLDLRWIETRQELIAYSVLVAGSVGMVMTYILGTPSADALEAAKSLGVAMQLTNVLRDVGEDLDRGRVYLPRAELAATPEALDGLAGRTMTAGLRTVMRAIAQQARERYGAGLAGIHYLDPPCRFAVVLAAALYSGILDKLEEPDHDVFRQRAHLTARERSTIAASSAPE